MTSCNEERMCFLTVANLAYQHYIPWYILFLNRAYPQAKKIVLLDSNICEHIKKNLDSVGTNNCEIREYAFGKHRSVDGNAIKILRWLYYESFLEDYDCVAIGDVDLAICRESPSFMEQHLRHCDKTGLPYSNYVRKSNTNLKPRMSGMHVIRPKRWFAAVLSIINEYREKLHTIKLSNEHILYRIIADSPLGEPPADLSSTYWSSIVTSAHHGIHIPIAVNQNAIKQLRAIPGFMYHKYEFLACIDTKSFKELSKAFPTTGRNFEAVRKIYQNED